MELKVISAATLDEFVAQNNKSHFMQTSAWGEVTETRNYIPHFLGVYDNSELVATALLLEKKIGIYSSFYCPRGPIVDYLNCELVRNVFSLLKEYVHRNKGLYLKVDPDIIIRKLDEDAKPISTNDENLKMLDVFTNLGFKHRGFTTRFFESSNPRFTFRVNVDRSIDEIVESFHKTTKKIIKRDNPYHLIIRKGNIDDVKHFYKTMKDTAKRKSIFLEPEDYFTNFYSILNKHNMSDIFVVEADLNLVKKAYEDRLNELNSEFESLNKYSEKKKEGLLKDLNDVKNKLEKEISLINKINEDRITLSSVITSKFNDKVWTIHGGNSDELMFLNGNYELYYEILKDAHKEGYKYVDFFGSEGIVNKNSDIYGIFLFKLRFGGDFDEFLGEFDYVARPFIYGIIQKLLNIRRRKIIVNSTK